MGTMRRIMVAIKDLDAASMPAVRKAAQLAMSSGATLELFHALSQSILIDALDARRISLADYEAEQIAAALKRLEVIAKRLRKHDVEVVCAAEWDFPPAEAIVRRALKTRADLIVAERHATRHVAGWMLAYTDWELLRQAPCAVLLVKLSRPYHRPVIMTAVDPFHEHAKPSKLDDALLETSARITEAAKGSLRIVHCVAPASMVTAGWMAGPVVIADPHSDATLKRARRALATEVARHPLPSHKLAVIEGVARDAIPLAAKSLKAQIVVMGALSRSGVQRILIGNTAEAVLDALPCDVLIVKPGKFQTKVPRKPRGAQLLALPTAMTG